MQVFISNIPTSSNFKSICKVAS